MSSLKLKFRLGGKGVTFYLGTFDWPIAWTKGIGSRCFDSQHVLFFDYDNIDQEDVENELAFLFKKFGLPDGFLLRTGVKSFHAINPAKMSLNKVAEILENSSCDPDYKDSAFRVYGKCWVLRTEPKGQRIAPFFLKKIKGVQDSKFPVSTAHLNYLSKHYGVQRETYDLEDREEKISEIIYNTGKAVSAVSKEKRI